MSAPKVTRHVRPGDPEPPADTPPDVAEFSDGLLLPLAAKAIRWAWPDDEFDGIEEWRAVNRALAETLEVRS